MLADGKLEIRGGDVLQWMLDECFDSRLMATKKLVAQQGGTYSGKTFNIMELFVILTSVYKRTMFTVAGKYLTSLKSGAMRDLDEILALYPELGDMFIVNKSSSEYRNKRTNSIIQFKSYETRQDAKMGKRGFLFVNECQGLSWDVFNELRLRTDYQTIIDFNPTSPFWFQDEFIKLWKDEELSKYMAWFVSTYKNNPFLSKDKIREIEALKIQDPQLWRVYGLGKWGKLEGVVFPNVVKVMMMPPKLDKVGYGLDFGFANNPTALVKCGIYDRKLWGKELCYGYRMFDADIDRMLSEEGVRKGLDIIMADPAQAQSVEYLKSRGWNIKKAEKKQGSVDFGISLLRSFSEICITEGSVNWHKEAKSYLWKEKDGVKLNVPVKAFDHCWDACRYYADEFVAQAGGDGYM